VETFCDEEFFNATTTVALVSCSVSDGVWVGNGSADTEDDVLWLNDIDVESVMDRSTLLASLVGDSVRGLGDVLLVEDRVKDWCDADAS
jgi:hypothetical protein